ncbi:MAG: NmrA family NAD(P)-binding protein [Mucilaginibacter sp.]|uniref:NmrA family NAD(P)-binding protein n=1 Tax=Mucilaginibacter sp. TaxID=1882438 RepID=UPI0031B08800
MNIILGASGQVGSAIVSNLLQTQQPVKGIVRNEGKGLQLKKQGAHIAVADTFNLSALTESFKNGSTLFVITPETGKGDDILGDAKKSLANIRKALESSPVKKVVGLSSMGAQYDKGTGNLLMSYFLEHAFKGMDIEQTFIRPAYYYSNWMLYLSAIKEKGILPTFYPVDLAIPMISPIDVAEFATEVIEDENNDGNIYELFGPRAYTSTDVATAFSKAIDKKVTAQQVPRSQWGETLKKAGFSDDAIKNFIEMTDLVISGQVHAQGKGTITEKTKTSLQDYINQAVKHIN